MSATRELASTAFGERRKLAALVLAVAAVGAESTLYAQDTVQHSENGFFVQTSGSMPAVCGFNFNIIYRDRTYLNGRLAGVVGSLSWAENNGNLGASLKILGTDLPDVTRRETAVKPVAVFRGFVSIDGKPLHPSFACGAADSFCGVYSVPTSAEIYSAIPSREITVSFAREANGLDISLPLDVVGGVRTSPKNFKDFNDCIGVLTAKPGK